MMKHANIWPKEILHLATNCPQIRQRFLFSVKWLGKNNLELLQLITIQLQWMCPIKKTELVNENYFCLKPSNSVKDYLLVFPQIILKTKMSHSSLYTLLSLFPGFSVLLYECVHICLYRNQNQNKLLQLLCLVHCAHVVHEAFRTK